MFYICSVISLQQRSKGMKTEITNPNNMLKPKRTLIQVHQAIQNLTALNVDGKYSERIMELEIEKLEVQIWIKENATTVRTTYNASPEEQKAIMLFNSDKKFKITE